MSPSKNSKQYSGTLFISLHDKPFLLGFLLLYFLYLVTSSSQTASFVALVVLCSVAGATDAVLDVEVDMWPLEGLWDVILDAIWDWCNCLG